MDGNHFDDLTRAFGSSLSRRGVVKGFGAAAIGAIAAAAGWRGAGAKSKRSVGNSCKVDADCASGFCVRERPTRKICHCGSATDCPASADQCRQAACQPSGYCTSVNVPIDCVVSDWSDWSACSVACGGGTQTRTRSVVTPASCGGLACPNLVDTQPCNSQVCGSCDAAQSAASCSTVTAVDDTEHCGRPNLGPTCCDTDADCGPNDGVTCTTLIPHFCAKSTQLGANPPFAVTCAADASKAGVCCCLGVCDITP